MKAQESRGKFIKTAAVWLICLLLTACGSKAPEAPAPSLPAPVTPEAVRAVWVSFLELDTALAGADSTAAAAYLDGVMSTCKQTGMNTVFFHVRAHSDAYYQSTIFPPADSAAALLAAGFDPLEYAVEAAHKNGLSLHAWINPYRIGEMKDKAVCADIFEQDGCWQYIPTSLTAQRYILDGVRELIKKYAIDGVQYDDYFYPSGVSATAMPFEKPGVLSVKEWRQAAVNTLIAGTCSAVHAREGCLFGVSPAGNLTRCTDRLYADVARWMAADGYLDYVCPQLYSGFQNAALPFEKEADIWAALPRAAGVRLYAGLALYKTGEADLFAGSGSAEWQSGGDILLRQANYVTGKGYGGLALFRYDHWTAAGGAVRTAEIAALKGRYFQS